MSCHGFQATPQSASTKPSLYSQETTGELPTQSAIDPLGQLETSTSFKVTKGQKKARVKKITAAQWHDRDIRASLRDSFRPDLLKLERREGGSAWLKSLAERFDDQITRTKGWCEKLGYIPGEHMEFASEIHHWEENPNTHCMTIHITGGPTEDNADVQVCHAYSG